MAACSVTIPQQRWQEAEYTSGSSIVDTVWDDQVGEKAF